MDNEQFIRDFQSNYDRIYNFLGASDHALMMSLASKYTLSKKQFSGVTLHKILETIEEQTNSLPIKNESNIGYKFAAYLLDDEDLIVTIKKLEENDHLLQKVKFKRTPFRVIAALFLQNNKEEHASRAKKLFDEMNRNQRFLTSNEDIPYSVLLTINKDSNLQQQAETIIRYYHDLKKHNFLIGNHLQALAQIMTIFNTDYNQVFMQYVIQLRDELVKRQVKVKKMHYPLLGILGLAATDDPKIDEIVRLYNCLKEQKVFRQSKDYALVVAIQKTVNDLLEIQHVVDLTTLNLIDQVLHTVGVLDDIITFLPTDILGFADYLK